MVMLTKKPPTPPSAYRLCVSHDTELLPERETEREIDGGGSEENRFLPKKRHGGANRFRVGI